MTKVRDYDLGGTPFYLSPEQRNQLTNKNEPFANHSRMPGEKVDIYAAGLVLFEMCGKFRTDMERYSGLDRLGRS